MSVTDRVYSWTDEARVVVWPRDPSAPLLHSDLATCVRNAVEVAEREPSAKVEIEHSTGFIPMEEIRRMAQAPDLPDHAPTNPQSRLP